MLNAREGRHCPQGASIDSPGLRPPLRGEEFRETSAEEASGEETDCSVRSLGPDGGGG